MCSCALCADSIQAGVTIASGCSYPFGRCRCSVNQMHQITNSEYGRKTAWQSNEWYTKGHSCTRIHFYHRIAMQAACSTDKEPCNKSSPATIASTKLSHRSGIWAAASVAM